MKLKLFILSFVGVLGSVLYSGCCNCPGDCTNLSSVSVQLRPQETDNWCWLANTQMIHEFFGHSISQCDLANTQLGKGNCCDNKGAASCPKTDDCNSAGTTEVAIQSLNYTLTKETSPLSWDEIRNEIFCNKRPLVFGDGPSGGGVGHVRVIYGYVNTGGTQFLSLMDPWAPCVGSDDVISYDDYANTAGPGRVHRKTLYQIVDKN